MSATWAMGKALSEQSCHAVHGRHLEQVLPAKLVLAGTRALSGTRTFSTPLPILARVGLRIVGDGGDRPAKNFSRIRPSLAARALNDLLWGGK
jgi:hypothetical protein